MEIVSQALPDFRFDVSAVASLRRRLGHAATGMKMMGFTSAIFIGAYFATPLGTGLSLGPLLLAATLASVVAKNLRGGKRWSGVTAALWSVSWAAFQVRDWTAKPQVFSVYTLIWAAVILGPLYFLVRGLVAFARYQLHQRRDEGPADHLAVNPYEEGLHIRRRPRFINKRSVAAYVLLVLAPLPYLLYWIYSRAEPSIYPNEWELRGAMTVQIGIGIGLFFLGVRTYRRARRAAMLPGSALIKRDTRPIVLYLRSFEDDSGIRLRARATNGRILAERLIKIPFEEVVTDHLWGYGPVLAIGDPRMARRTVVLGAARDYVEDSGWRQRAMELMRDAAMIVVVANGTSGLAWEVDTIAGMNLASKLVVLLPPVPLEELQARWQLLAGRSTSGLVPWQVDFTRLRALTFPESSVAFIYGRKRNDWTYEAVLDEAALLILKDRGVLCAPAAATSGPLRRMIWTAASLIPSVVGSALVLWLLAILLLASEAAENLRPYASPGRVRDQFIADVLQTCRDKNLKLSASQLNEYCGCFATDLADTITKQDLDAVSSHHERASPKVASVAHACAERTIKR
jgi:hypothetical protein